QSEEASIEIGDEIVGIFEPGMDAKHRTLGCERLCSAKDRSRHDETFIAAPRKPDPEVLKAVNEGSDGALGTGLQLESKKTARAREVTPPDCVAGVTLQRRIKYAGDLAARGKPAREPHRRFLVPLEARRK